MNNGERCKKFIEQLDKLLGDKTLPTYNPEKHEFVKLIKANQDMEYAFFSLAALFATEFPDIFVEMVCVYQGAREMYRDMIKQAMREAQSATKN